MDIKGKSYMQKIAQMLDVKPGKRFELQEYNPNTLKHGKVLDGVFFFTESMFLNRCDVSGGSFITIPVPERLYELLSGWLVVVKENEQVCCCYCEEPNAYVKEWSKLTSHENLPGFNVSDLKGKEAETLIELFKNGKIVGFDVDGNGTTYRLNFSLNEAPLKAWKLLTKVFMNPEND